MGDCNLRIRLSDALQKDLAQGNASTTTTTMPQVAPHKRLRLASDATLKDLLETRLNNDDNTQDGSLTISTLIRNKGTKLWDCTYHPAKDVSAMAATQDSVVSLGLTLFDAGWYPSGTLVLAKPDEGDPTTRFVNYDDVQYNAPSSSSNQSDNDAPPKATAAVQLKHHDGPVLPSQLLQSVTKRFDDQDPETDTAIARHLRHETAQQARQREAQRQAKLQARIVQLDQTKGGVANQVQKMLIKSRAVGRANLAEQDRVYLRVLVHNDDDDDDSSIENNDKGSSSDKNALQEDFCFVSRQDVVGKVLSQRSTKPKFVSELLVRQSQDETSYRRLPNLMRVYEAIEAGFLQSFDRVVIRVYDPTKDEPTLGVTMESSTAAPPTLSPKVTLATMAVDTASTTVDDAPTSVLAETSNDEDDVMVDASLAAALAEMDKPKKGKATKSSAASIKVRQMQMKSKAKGDVKRVKMPDRFFVEIVLASRRGGDDGSTTTTTSIQAPAAPYFLAQSDPLQRLVKDGWVKVPSSLAGEIQFWTCTAEPNTFRRVNEPSTSVQQLSAQGVLHAFDRIILLTG